MSFDVIIAAAGQSTRFCGEKNKLLCVLNNATVIENTLRAFLLHGEINNIVVAVSDNNEREIKEILKDLSPKIKIILGGKNRTETVRKSLSYTKSDFVLIHDGARPFVSTDLIDRVIQGTVNNNACVPVISLSDSLIKYPPYTVADRCDYRSVQTPQGFKRDLIIYAYDNAKGEFTDDASVYLKSFSQIAVVDGDILNRKITTKEDLCLPLCRTGVGYDTHRLVTDKKLILGNVEIPFEKGLSGYSDADVLTHAIMDALLSAAGLRDIGIQFPDNDLNYKNIDSFKLLDKVRILIDEAGYKCNNISATILAQEPKLNSYIPAMINNFASALNLRTTDVGILATTTEKMGDIGLGKAISAFATVSIINK